MDLDLPPYSFPGLPEESNDEFMKVSGDEFMMKGNIKKFVLGIQSIT